MNKFENWFNDSLRVRSYPNLLDLQNKYIIEDVQIIINVSDCIKTDIYSKIREMGLEYFWFPMNESYYDIGLNSIYAACCIMYGAEISNKKVLLHCWGGANRSQSVAQAYYFLRTKKHLITDYKGYKNQLEYNCNHGFLPALDKVEAFLSLLSTKLSFDIVGGELDTLKSKMNETK